MPKLLAYLKGGAVEGGATSASAKLLEWSQLCLHFLGDSLDAITAFDCAPTWLHLAEKETLTQARAPPRTTPVPSRHSPLATRHSPLGPHRSPRRSQLAVAGTESPPNLGMESPILAALLVQLAPLLQRTSE